MSSHNNPGSSNSNQTDPRQHPLMATVQAIAGAVQGEHRTPRMTHMMNANEGPADIISKVAGVTSGGKRSDDAPYFTTTKASLGLMPPTARPLSLERMVHPCGSGAFGFFECTSDVSNLTKANFLQKVGEKTPVFVRFSTVILGREFPDEARNPRGFAIKFYTMEGNYDIVSLNFPIFFCRNPIQGPDVIKSQYRDPRNFFFDWESTFDFLGNNAEGNHAGLMFFSDHGTPIGWRYNNGYGCHTFKWVNQAGEFVYIKYHFMGKHGTKRFTDAEAAGEEIEWTAYVQVMKPEDADPEKLVFDPFDITNVWPRKLFPMQEFGRLVFNKNPEDYHRDVEQAAFSPGSMVPGIEDSPDPLLQFRMFFYRDAQYHRIGINLHQIPVNCPFMAMSYSSPNIGGTMRVDANAAGNPQYVPSSFVSKFRNDTAEAPYQTSDNICSRRSHFWHEGKKNDYDQARELYQRVMSEQEKANLATNTAKYLSQVRHKEIKLCFLAQWHNIDPKLAESDYTALRDEAKKDFTLEEVATKSQDAELWNKAAKFRPAPGTKLQGAPCPAGMEYGA
ncbi:catalase-like domain-containing protein [Sordaria sp. MPI-SDFR-AT-0083]|nr:catalase-like domain-containing protein [Sordaria sp. MPI-SDFR-AT-0083]